MKTKLFSSVLFAGIVGVSAAWLVIPNGGGWVLKEEAMLAMGLDPSDPTQVEDYVARAKAQAINLHLVRNATYDVPCTNDGGATVRTFRRSQSIDADLVYRYNPVREALKLISFGAGSVTNNVKCPGGYLRLDDAEGVTVPATWVSGTETLYVDGTPLGSSSRER